MCYVCIDAYLYLYMIQIDTHTDIYTYRHTYSIGSVPPKNPDWCNTSLGFIRIMWHKVCKRPVTWWMICTNLSINDKKKRSSDSNWFHFFPPALHSLRAQCVWTLDGSVSSQCCYLIGHRWMQDSGLGWMRMEPKSTISEPWVQVLLWGTCWFGDYDGHL